MGGLTCAAANGGIASRLPSARPVAAGAELFALAVRKLRGSAETPLDEHNHALAALRYLISRLDERRMALTAAARMEQAQADQRTLGATRELAATRERTWLEMVEDERLWGEAG
jgi:hypothetical protein